MEIQKKELLSFVKDERGKGRRVFEILQNMKVSRSSYYRWLKDSNREPMPKSSSRLTVRCVSPSEFVRVDKLKDDHPEMRHRQIQGLLQSQGHFLSASSVYTHLKRQGKVEPYERRAAAWKEPRYELLGAKPHVGCGLVSAPHRGKPLVFAHTH